jgi:hypothetical protein
MFTIVEKWIVSITDMTCIYFDKQGIRIWLNRSLPNGNSLQLSYPDISELRFISVVL